MGVGFVGWCVFFQTVMTSATVVPIGFTTAQTHGWKPPGNYHFARTMPVAWVQLGELSALVPNLPLAFARTATDEFKLVAVTGFADGRNQAVAEDGRWVLPYVPLGVACYPFVAQRLPASAEGKPAVGVCFNHDSGLYRDAPDAALGEMPFFRADGSAQPLFRRMTERLQQAVSQQPLTQSAVLALQQAGVLSPWQVQPREGHPEETLPAGLFRVDEPKLNALSGEALHTLHQVHALALAYSQLLSMGRLAVLHSLKDAHERAAQAAAAKAAAVPDPSIVEKLFDGGMGDTLKFHF